MSGLHVLLRASFEVFDGSAVLRVLEVEIVQQRFEGGIAHLRAHHVKNHGPFVHDHRAVIAGIGRQSRGLGDGRGVFIHQSADSEFIDSFQAGFFARVLFGV